MESGQKDSWAGHKQWAMALERLRIGYANQSPNAGIFGFVQRKQAVIGRELENRAILGERGAFLFVGRAHIHN